ncbi:hypothetical protein [Magnetofaba australis]|uniref:Uncharacterized protein n=1 Tax=Magnetofaba australis IT-1 TaxID=1434232 RepID=A0A1Y2K2M2_9PROT|nr:hypothetical protein [Magnetofaba australis]OSM00442.1 hypothetical protein MAIT1_00962 [Magnetofaba australis IT-1]
MSNPSIATLIITRQEFSPTLLEQVAARLPAPWEFNLFFVHSGACLATEELTVIPRQRDRIVCSFSHQHFKAPTPTEETEPGSLYDLSGMIVESQLTLSLPALHWPDESAMRQASDQVAIVIPRPTPKERNKQALRAAAALASKGLTVTVYQPTEQLPGSANVAEAFRETLLDMNGRLLTAPPTPQELNQYGIVLEW